MGESGLVFLFIHKGCEASFTAAGSALVDYTFLGCFIKLRIELAQHLCTVFAILGTLHGLGQSLDGALDIVVPGGSLLVCAHSFKRGFVLWHVFLFYLA
ncbi:hypothetical protein DSECCO2_560430 [anaerobic digester metagenome]